MKTQLFSVKGVTEDEVFETVLNEGADVKDIETDGDEVVITADAKEYNNVRKALTSANLEIDLDEVSMVALDKVTLEGEDLELFNKLMNMLDEIEDVQNVYHNVEL